jgi:hypothetical protein
LVSAEAAKGAVIVAVFWGYGERLLKSLWWVDEKIGNTLLLLHVTFQANGSTYCSVSMGKPALLCTTTTANKPIKL